MRQTFQLILYVAVATVLTAGCTGKRSQTEGESASQPQPTDTLYTAEKALMVYDYEPERALQIIDSAVIVGNVSDRLATVIHQELAALFPGTAFTDRGHHDFDSFPLGSVPRRDNK